MYKDILESIEKIEISRKYYKPILMENCLDNIFSWNPFRIRNCEYYKRFLDWKALKRYKQDGHNTSDNYIKNKMSSSFYKEKFRNRKPIDDDISMLISYFKNDDIKIVLTLQVLNSQVWHNRIGTL